MVLETDPERAVEAADDVPAAEDVYDPDEPIHLREIFDDEFVATHTGFGTLDELIAASPSDAASAEELDHVSAGEWDAFVEARTDFDDEEAMVMAARDHWVAKTLGL